ncbi:hypothetical protein F5Y05DRAFT_387197 [Hypoxylon sp. FL0543]|nr:hypothetical protein F5Y05DRAFT_387197 [Hypoxylon sp. FL0543]
MSLPSTNPNGSGQPSIRNFFQPKSPSYASPPVATRTQGAAAATPPPPPPPPAAVRPAVVAGRNGPKSPLSPPPASIPPTRPPSLHPQATIAPILPEYIPALRRITSLLLPVNYPDSFYARLSDPLSSGAFSRVLLWTDPDSNAAPKVIGGLVCRPEPSPFTSSRNKPQHPTRPDSQPNALYVQSLVLLAPYRQLGLAAALLDEVVRLAAASPFACNEVYAHVWTDNEDGLRWYLARGFYKHGEVKGYYFKLKPDSAWIVRRQIASNPNPNPNDAHSNSTTSGSKPTASTNGAIPPSVTAAAANLLTRQTPTPPALATTAPTPSPSASGTLSPPPPPPRSSSGPSPNRSPGLSYQKARPETEWNDLPADMHASAPGSSASSRSSSAAPRKKRDRAYPAAAFGK